MDDPINAPSAAVTGSLLLSPPISRRVPPKRYSPSLFIHISRLKKRRKKRAERNPYEITYYTTYTWKIDLRLYNRVRAIARKRGSLLLNRPSINSWIHLANIHTHSLLSLFHWSYVTLYNVGVETFHQILYVHRVL